ncbi:peptidase S24/S26A/S26B/S26C [Russula ochroleuca]|uniref:Mitochondrial inner membrane protease subunit 2 n=1 Tax=Russula ochroleuca TaxID=152965 RepID=A0A9P5N2I8_9AGAM|nr:peptidase S24/S26A/S26B/S26C [Russula ochroleuca]
MHHPSHPFGLVGRWSRNAYNYWKNVSSRQPLVRRVQSALFWLPTMTVFTQVGCTIRAVTGNSMQPTLNPDLSRPRDVAIFNRWSIVIKRRYERGDVVAFRSPQEYGKLLVKRLIALPGDKVVKTLPPYPDTEVIIPDGHGWLEGDAPFNSEDSNHFGPVPLALIDSKLSCVLWPLDRVRAIDFHTTGTQAERVVQRSRT